MGVTCMGVVSVSSGLKKELAWTIDKWLWVISSFIVFCVGGSKDSTVL